MEAALHAQQAALRSAAGAGNIMAESTWLNHLYPEATTGTSHGAGLVSHTYALLGRREMQGLCGQAEAALGVG